MQGTVTTTAGFCIYIDTLCEGAVPAVRDGQGKPCVFETEVEAQREIADNVITRLQEFIDGEREFEDALTVEEYIVEVDVLPDGSIIDSASNHFGVTHDVDPEPKASYAVQQRSFTSTIL